MKVTAYYGSLDEIEFFKHSRSGIQFVSYDHAVHDAERLYAQMSRKEMDRIALIPHWHMKVYECKIDVGRSKRIKDDPVSHNAWVHQVRLALEQGYDSITYSSQYDAEHGLDFTSYCVFCASRVLDIKLHFNSHRLVPNQPLIMPWEVTVSRIRA